MSSAAILAEIKEKEAQRGICASILGILVSLSSGMCSCVPNLGSAAGNIAAGLVCQSKPADNGKIDLIIEDIKSFNAANDEAIQSTNDSILALDGEIQALWGAYRAALAREQAEAERIAAQIAEQGNFRKRWNEINKI